MAEFVTSDAGITREMWLHFPDVLRGSTYEYDIAGMDHMERKVLKYK